MKKLFDFAWYPRVVPEPVFTRRELEEIRALIREEVARSRLSGEDLLREIDKATQLRRFQGLLP